MKPLQANTWEMTVAQEIFKTHPFAVLLLGQTSSPLPEVSHIPLLFDASKGLFEGHLAKNNPQVNLLTKGPQQAMLIFRAEHGYVSPTWAEDIKVPTWDYCVVHVQGKLSIIEDPQQSRQSMGRQIASFESSWSMDQLPTNQLDALLNAICVLKLDIKQMSYRYKMSQTKSAAVKTAITSHFEQQGKLPLVAQYQRFNLNLT